MNEVAGILADYWRQACDTGIVSCGGIGEGKTEPPTKRRRKRMHRVFVVLMAASVAALLALGAGSALAQEDKQAATTKEDGVSVIKASNQRIQCTGVPCIATGRDDLVFERIGNGKRDRIILRGGDDQVRANTYRNDKDVIKGTSGFDLIYVDDGDTRDRVFGGKGNDKCFVDARSEAVAGCSRIIVD